jgi:hypothetical protein
LANGGQIAKEPQKQAEKPSANGQTDRDLNSKKNRVFGQIHRIKR